MSGPVPMDVITLSSSEVNQTVVHLRETVANQELLLAFLKYFYDTASDYMGPADGDIYADIKQRFRAIHHQLPKGYDPEEEETD